MTKITKRAMYEALIETMKTGTCAYAPEDVIAFCENELALIDKKNAKAKERAAAKAKEADALQNDVLAVLSADFEPIADIAARVTNPDATVSKVTYRLNALVAAGLAVKEQITVTGAEGGKSRKVMGFALAPVDAE